MCEREWAKRFIPFRTLLFPLEKPALPHFHRERRGRGCLEQRDCAKLCAPPLQNLPETCRKCLGKRRLLKAMATRAAACVVVLPTRLCQRCQSCSAWHHWCLSCHLALALAPQRRLRQGAKQLGVAGVRKYRNHGVFFSSSSDPGWPTGSSVPRRAHVLLHLIPFFPSMSFCAFKRIQSKNKFNYNNFVKDRLFSSLLPQCFLTVTSVFSNSVTVMK